MQREEFDERWERVAEWMEAPRVLMSTDDLRFVGKRSSDKPERVRIDVYVERRESDALGDARWMCSEVIRAGAWFAEPGSHASLAWFEVVMREDGKQ